MAVNIRTGQVRWVFDTVNHCFGIAHWSTGITGNHLHIAVPLCYASLRLIEWGGLKRDLNYPVIHLGANPDVWDDKLIIPGASVEWEFIEPEYDIYGKPIASGKITINGQVVYGSTPFGMVWTPVRPDMGDIDIYSVTGKSV